MRVVNVELNITSYGSYVKPVKLVIKLVLNISEY